MMKGAKKGLGYRQQPSSRRRHKRSMLPQTQGAGTGVRPSTGSSHRRTWPSPVSARPSAHWSRMLAHRQGAQALPQRWVADGCEGCWSAVCNVGGQTAGALKGLLFEEPCVALQAQLAQLLACGAGQQCSAGGRFQVEGRARQGRAGHDPCRAPLGGSPRPCLRACTRTHVITCSAYSSPPSD